MATPLEEIRQLGTRVLSPHNIDFADDVDDDLVELLGELSEDDIADSLKQLPEYKNLASREKKKIESVLYAAHYLGKAAYNHADQTGLAVTDITIAVRRSADGTDEVDAFVIPYLQILYRKWRQERWKAYKAWADKAENAGKPFDQYATSLGLSGVTEKEYFSAASYVGATRSGESLAGQLLKALLGDNYTSTVKKATRKQEKDPWAFFRRFYRPMPASEDPLAELAKIAKDRTKLSAAIESSITHIEDINLERQLDYPQDLFTSVFQPGSELREKLIDKVELVFKAYANDAGELDATGIRKLVGKRRHAPEQIMDELVGGFALLYREVHKIKIAEGMKDLKMEDLLEMEDLLVKFLSIDGMENMFEMLLRQVDHEHGYIFEQLITFGYLQKGFDPELIILQSRIGDRMGPDLLVLMWKQVDGKKVLVARDIQMKSFLSLGAVLRATGSGQALSQSKNDVRRLIKEIVTQDKSGAENIGLTYDSIITFKIDWTRLQLDAYESDIAKIIDGIEDAGIQAQLRAMDPSAVLSVSDPVLSSAVRGSFKKLYVNPMTDEINDALKVYEDEWINIFLNKGAASDNEIKNALVEEFNLGLPRNPGDGREKFYRLLDMAEAGEPIDTELRDIYRSTFNLSADEVITVEVDIVDAMIDDDLAGLIPN